MGMQSFDAIITLAAAIGQLGVAIAAFKLASALKIRVDVHEVRIGVLEQKAA